MKSYKYTRSTTAHVTIDGVEHTLSEGGTYELPEVNKFVRSLIRQGYLIPAGPEYQKTLSKRKRRRNKDQTTFLNI